MNDLNMVYLAVAAVGCFFSSFAAIFAFLSWRQRKIQVPDFLVYFPGERYSRITKADELTKITIEIENTGAEVAENIEAHIFIPPEFRISPQDQPDYEPRIHISFLSEYETPQKDQLDEVDWLSKEPSDSKFPNFWNAVFHIGDLGPDYSTSIEIVVKAPSTARGYEVFVDLICKGVGTQTHHLFLDVF